MQALPAEAPRDAVGEVDVCCFGLPIGHPGLVGVGLGEVEVVRAGGGDAVAEGGDGNDAGAGGGCAGGEEEGFEQVEEQEVREVVCAELRFEAVFGLALGGGHYAGILLLEGTSSSRGKWEVDVPSVEDGDVQLVGQLLDLSGSLPDALQGLVVHENQGDFALGRSVALDLFHDCFAFLQVAHSADYVRSGGVNCPQGLNANSRGHASDEEGLVCELASEAFVFDDLKSCWSGIARTVKGGVDGGVARHV